MKERELVEAKAKDFIERLQVSQNAGGVSQSSGPSNAISSGVNNEGQPAPATNVLPQDPNTAFLLQASNSKTEREYATHFGPLPYVIGQGKFIFATLAVAINSDLAGQIEAVVSQDVYGEQGRKVLIPRGSHLIGQYRSGLSNNQSRLFTVWTRIKEPNGVDIQLGSEGTDTLGRAGLTGNVDYHFFDRFGSSLLVSLIGAGAANIGVNSSDQYNSASAYRTGIAEAMSEQGKSLLSQNINIPPTINIAQGEKIVVFVNRDLDFSRVYR
jgi:type IV secretion system protein VirB10